MSEEITKSSHGAFPDPTYEPGAIWQLRLRVAWQSIDKYMKKYNEWFFDVDTAPCNGRRLLTILSPEFGEKYNLVFLFWYESRYKVDYYRKYDEGFFRYHLEKGDTETLEHLLEQYTKAARMFPITQPDNLAAIPTDLGKWKAYLLNRDNWDKNELVPRAAGEVIRRVDAVEFRPLVEWEESSWSFGVNPRRVVRYLDAFATATPANERDIPPSLLGEVLEGVLEREKLCPDSHGRPY